MDKLLLDMLKTVADYNGEFKGAYNIRVNGGCEGRRSTDNILIESKPDAPGLIITVKPGTKGEAAYIPACVTHGEVDDLVYNDFVIGEGADILIVAGCGVHSDDPQAARHTGIHRFIMAKGSRVTYQEKHIGTGSGSGQKNIDPVTEAYLDEGAELTMDTIQLGGVDNTTRKTVAKLAARAKLKIRERLLTDDENVAKTEFEVSLDGEDAGVDIVSRSVARGSSYQEYHSKISGNCRCTGHSECDALLSDSGRVNAAPELYAGSVDASLIHEAAIGKIAGEQIIKLCSLGLTEQEAESRIIAGFLK